MSDELDGLLSATTETMFRVADTSPVEYDEIPPEMEFCAWLLTEAKRVDALDRKAVA